MARITPMPTEKAVPVLITAVDTKEIQPLDGKHFSLEELQGYVRGDIQILFLAHNLALIVNEAGEEKMLLPNLIASELARQDICGPAVLCQLHYLEK